MNQYSLQVSALGNAQGMRELSALELDEVSGGDGMGVATGVAVVAAAVGFVLTAPITIPVLVTGAIGATAGGWIIFYSLPG